MFLNATCIPFRLFVQTLTKLLYSLVLVSVELNRKFLLLKPTFHSKLFPFPWTSFIYIKSVWTNKGAFDRGLCDLMKAYKNNTIDIYRYLGVKTSNTIHNRPQWGKGNCCLIPVFRNQFPCKLISWEVF